jgi:hypothetical protein
MWNVFDVISTPREPLYDVEHRSERHGTPFRSDGCTRILLVAKSVMSLLT